MFARTAVVVGLLALTGTDAFLPPSSLPLRSRAFSPAITVKMVAVDKPGTGNNRMTDTGFTVPIVEKVSVPGSIGYEYKVKDGILNEKKLNAIEKVKIAKGGLQIIDQLDELAEEAKKVGGAQNMDPDEINFRLKWMGLFHRPKAPGTFMWRFRIHNGQMTSKQWRVLADQIKEYDTGSRDLWEQMGCADVTTRQNIQLRGMTLENMPRHWKAATDAGLISMQSGLDNVRNLVGNPLAGIDPEEIIDTRPYCKEFTEKLTNNGKGNPALANLPRKFNVCYVGSPDMFEHPDINDIAYMPAKDSNGNMGWNIEVGGLLTSTLCEFAVPLDAFVPLDKHWELGEAIMTLFRDFGYRYNPRTKCRLMWLVNDMGITAFREEVARRYKEATGEDLPRAETGLVPKDWQRRELVGVHKQSDGKNWIGLVVPAGRMYADQMDTIADIADEFGSSTIRMTVEGNVLIIDIPDDKLEAAKAKADGIKGLEMTPNMIMKNTVACAGNQFCSQSKINTKGYAVQFANYLDDKYDFPEGKEVRVHWTGCPNTCGQIQVGDIGLLGTTCKDSSGQVVEGVDVFIGGGIGQTSALGTLYKGKVPIDEGLEAVLDEAAVEKFGATPKGGSGGGIGGFFKNLFA